jgi:NmrA-like family
MHGSGVKCGTMMARGLLTGDTNDLASVAAALDGAYGAWVNIDGFTVGEQREIYAGMRIFELAKQTKSLRHYVWSSLGYNLKVRVNILSIYPRTIVLDLHGADGWL